jgi:CHAD domain-containing protein
MAPSGKWIEGISPETTVIDAARRSLELRLAVVAHMLPLAAHLAEHDIEHVHRLRVATRRAAAALKLYRDWLPQKSARWIKKRLRQIRRAASEARDLDVLIQRLQSNSGTQAASIVPFLVEKRAAVQPNIVEAAEDMRHDDRFVRKAARLFSKIAPSENESDATPPEGLRNWAPQQLASFRSAFLELLPNGSDDIEALHQFRIRTKSLRYAIELLAPAFEPQMRDVIYPAVEKLQERIGKVTDHIAAIRLFAEWETHNAAQTPCEDASFLELEKTQEAEDLRDFRDWWSSARTDWLEQSFVNQTGMACGQS